MAVSVTKGSGRYFWDFERVWTETRDTGVQPFWVGKLPSWLNLPAQPNPQLLQSMCDGRAYLPHVQQNRVGCYDVTVSFGKSVSLLAYGLTPPKEQKGWTETFARISKPEIEKVVNDQRLNLGAQGNQKVPSQGVAVGFFHREGYRGQDQAHAHYAVINLTTDGIGAVRSIAGVRDGLYAKQGVLNARVQKSLDDELQARGFETVRIGKNVELAKVPKELRDELSPARQAMNEARKEKGFSGPRAMDFYARQARKDSGPRVHKTPDEAHRDSTELAKKYGVTLESLKRDPKSPAPTRDPASEMGVAYDVAKKALRSCAKKHGDFTADQFYERLYLLGIGKQTTLAALEGMGKAFLKDRDIAQVREKKQRDGTVKYSAPESSKVEREAKRAYKPDSKEAWDGLKAAAKGFGEAVLIATAKKATTVVKKLAGMDTPPSKTRTVSPEKLPDLLDRLSPTNYAVAHAKALLAGLKAKGNPHEKAGVAEKVYAELRERAQLPKNMILVVERADRASGGDLLRLRKLADKAGASVILAERDVPGHERIRDRDIGGPLKRHHGRDL